MLPKVKYLNVQNIILAQRKAVFQKIKQFSKSHIVYPGIDFHGKDRLNPEQVPGLREFTLFVP